MTQLWDLFLILCVIVFGLVGIWVSLIVITKRNFFTQQRYSIYRNFLSLPVIVNYWILKLIYLVGGIIVTLLGIMLAFRDL